MPYKMNQAQFAHILSLPAQDCYDHFVSKVTDWEELWTLKGADGFVLLGDESGCQCVPVWPHPDYALALAKDSGNDCLPERLELDAFMSRWISGMIGDNRMVAVFPTPSREGAVVDPKRLEEDLMAEIEQYE